MTILANYNPPQIKDASWSLVNIDAGVIERLECDVGVVERFEWMHEQLTASDHNRSSWTFDSGELKIYIMVS